MQKFHPAVFNAMQHCYILIAGLGRLSCISRMSLISKAFQPDSILAMDSPLFLACGPFYLASRLCPMLNSQRDSAAGFLIEDEVFTGFCGSKFLNPRLSVIGSHFRF
jgi:hypothetical protein